MKTETNLYKVKEQVGAYVIFDRPISEKSQIYLAYNQELKYECCAKILWNADEIKNETNSLQAIQLYLAIQSIYTDNIVKIYQFIYNQKNQNYYLFYERCEANLTEYLNGLRQEKQKLGDKELLDFICQITQGYKTLLELNIIHRDIKPQNILIKHDLNKNKRFYKICDFGISKIDFDKRLQTPQIQGTMAYVAPEVRSNYQNTPASDIYSFGLVLLEMLVEEELQDSQKKQLESYLNQYQLTEYFNGKQQVTENFQKLKFLDKLKNYENFVSILHSLLQQKPEKRMNWQQLSQKASLLLDKLCQTKQNSSTIFKKLPDVGYDQTLPLTNYNLNNVVSQSAANQLGQEQYANVQGYRLISGQSNIKPHFNQNTQQPMVGQQNQANFNQNTQQPIVEQQSQTNFNQNTQQPIVEQQSQTNFNQNKQQPMVGQQSVISANTGQRHQFNQVNNQQFQKKTQL